MDGVSLDLAGRVSRDARDDSMILGGGEGQFDRIDSRTPRPADS